MYIVDFCLKMVNLGLKGSCHGDRTATRARCNPMRKKMRGLGAKEIKKNGSASSCVEIGILVSSSKVMCEIDWYECNLETTKEPRVFH